MGNLTALLANIRPSLEKLHYTGVPSSKNSTLVQQVADQNAKDAADMIMKKSPVIAELVKEGKGENRFSHARRQHREDHLVCVVRRGPGRMQGS